MFDVTERFYCENALLYDKEKQHEHQNNEGKESLPHPNKLNLYLSSSTQNAMYGRRAMVEAKRRHEEKTRVEKAYRNVMHMYYGHNS